jgi:hypothetical protein
MYFFLKMLMNIFWIPRLRFGRYRLHNKYITKLSNKIVGLLSNIKESRNKHASLANHVDQ